MASLQDVSALAQGCTDILVLLLRYPGGSGTSLRHPAIDEATVVLATASVAAVIVAHFAGVVLAHLPPAAPAPPSSVCDLGRLFVVLVFTLVFAWLIVVAALLAAFFFFGGIGQGFGWNVLG